MSAKGAAHEYFICFCAAPSALDILSRVLPQPVEVESLFDKVLKKSNCGMYYVQVSGRIGSGQEFGGC